ncbi:MAG: zinc-dependent metalloprotease, partial [Gemmatimonadota bacterium]
NTVYLEVPESMLDKDFGLIMHISRGTGVFNVHQGLRLSSAQLMRLQRVGDKIILQHRNTRFTADDGSPMRASVEGNTGHSIVAAWDIASEHDSTDNVLADITKFLVSDYAQFGRRLRPYFNDRPASLDGDRSYVDGIQGYPKNVEIDAMLTYKSSERPAFGGEGIPDVRSVPIGVRYSVFALPDDPMTVRFADDRVGHFLDARKNFSRDKESTLYERIVRRWRLEKKDPTAEMSEPVEPIVFYVDHSVPEEYRPYVRRGIEAWNSAFEQAGFLNAIEARDAPDDPEWNAEDIRYSAVRWTAAHQMGYAIGPSQSDPRTGEQLNGDVLISSGFMSGWVWTYQRLANPGTTSEQPISDLASLIRTREQLDSQVLDLDPWQAAHLCYAEVGKAHQLGFQHAALLGLGVLDPGDDVPEEYIGDAIIDLVLHEVGHVLGLRHNFKSSSGVPTESLHDKAFTGRNGVSLSVMDYTPVNLAVDPENQGHYWNVTAGSYDRWAIQYAYSTIYEQDETGALVTSGTPAGSSEAETNGLRKIAAQAADPMHTYGTDEDNWLGSFAVDPLSSAWDLGSDHIAYARDRARIVEKIMPTIETRVLEDGDGYQRLRSAVTSLMFERFNSTVPVIKYVGGAYVVRDHRGDPGQRPAFTPVGAQRQREAVELIVETMLAENAFEFDADLLNKLLPNRWSHWGESPSTILQFPVLSNMQAIHGSLLGNLFTPPRLARMLDQEALAERRNDAYTVAEMMSTLTTAIWSEVGSGVNARSTDAIRRNLQRIHTDQLAALALSRAVPGDASALARLELTELSRRLGAALGRARIDRATRAHLAETRARIERTLEASIVLD